MPQATVTRLGDVREGKSGQYRYIHFDGAKDGMAVSTKDPCWDDAVKLAEGDVVKYETKVNGKWTNLVSLEKVGGGGGGVGGGGATQTATQRNTSIEAQVMLKCSIELMTTGKVADMKEAAGVVQAIFDMHKAYLANPGPSADDIPF